eukprot:Ihof_evm5s371 gene=Ihof_evmTU5s371
MRLGTPSSKIRKSVYTKWYQRAQGVISIFCVLVMHLPLGLATNMSPLYYNVWILVVILLFSTLVTSYIMDPGVIPPSDEEQGMSMHMPSVDMGGEHSSNFNTPLLEHELHEDCYHNPTSSTNSSFQSPHRESEAEPEAKERTVDGVTYKWCVTCHIWRGPQATHCSDCGFCMERFDHHCGAIGNCVAYRNHRVFIIMLCFAGTMFVMLLAAGATEASRLKAEGNQWNDYHWYINVFLAIYGGYASVFAVGFSIAQCGLAASGLTEKQCLRGSAEVFTKLRLKRAPRTFLDFWMQPL